ncbi:MAG: tRNA uridine-5-carboxymethylaminomethyl(34) synthesis GTPase MnmE [Ponticaulis sp.]|nr:tRNA uridine-5-carboxymethylaminomethyl(34) synthesis GTPase MnmE [Ponticaulis sp.]|tara:strand:- start:44799 stop:46145 length:1347 start_codon:yes stop_codon:yes gene_type:complete
MTHQETDTIIALSSAHGRAGVAVLRISGPEAFQILEYLTLSTAPPIRRAVKRNLYDFADRDHVIDEALILRFAGPESFTGEDLVEVHCHGSPAIIETLISGVVDHAACRLAEPGEFSRRAFENGKIDLIQAEGIADLIESQSVEQMKQAARFLAGDASHTIEAWRKRILEASAYLAASIDFSDEGDVSEDAHAPVSQIIDDLITEFSSALSTAKSASRVRDGLRIAILGKPNAGKSTLINALAQREAAIVSEIPGTTRDVLEAHIVVKGVPVTIADTAGLRDTLDPVEAEGVRRARVWAENADLRVYLSRADDNVDDGKAQKLESHDLLIISQADRVSGDDKFAHSDLALSVATGEGMADFVDLLESRIVELTSSKDAPTIVRLRHQKSLSTAMSALKQSKMLLQENGDVDLSAFELSVARSALDQILGRVDVEDILGEVFSGFCVGK